MFYIFLYFFVHICVLFGLFFYFINEIIYFFIKPYLFVTLNSIFLYKNLFDIYLLKYQLIFYIVVIIVIPFFFFLKIFFFKNTLNYKYYVYLKNIFNLNLSIYIVFNLLVFLLSSFLIYYSLLPVNLQNNYLINFRFELFLTDYFYFYGYIYLYAILFCFFCVVQSFYYLKYCEYFFYNKLLFICFYIILFFCVWTPSGDINGGIVLPLIISIYMLFLFCFYNLFNYIFSFNIKYYNYFLYC